MNNIDDLRKIINNNNINKEKFYDLNLNNSLTKCEIQLSDKKKNQNGFDLFDSVLDVTQGGYAISYGDDYLFTYGIETCCSVVLYDDLKCMLFHLDGKSSPEEVKKITDSFGFNSDAKVLICPGVTCGIPGSFEYCELEKIYNDVGCDTTVRRIDSTFGYIAVYDTDIRVGSALFKENEILFERKTSRGKQKHA